jgi:hypothetical protein
MKRLRRRLIQRVVSVDRSTLSWPGAARMRATRPRSSAFSRSKPEIAGAPRRPLGSIASLPRFSMSARLTLCLLALFWPARGQGDAMLENAVKATYLYKLAAFVTWPSGTVPARAFVICVVGDDPFGAVLNQAVAGQTVQQHPIAIQRDATITNNPGCQLMYVAGSDAEPVAAALAAVRGAPVLTVTDGQSAANPAGMINFVLQDGYVRFEIDPQLATQAGLNISSKLLSLAVRLRDPRSP